MREMRHGMSMPNYARVSRSAVDRGRGHPSYEAGEGSGIIDGAFEGTEVEYIFLGVRCSHSWRIS